MRQDEVLLVRDADVVDGVTFGDIQGPGLKHEQVAPAVRRMIDVYLKLRTSKDEKFIDVMTRVGQAPFKEALYASA
jgi:sulfite reductase (NADPH) hemoprotein beta-component